MSGSKRSGRSSSGRPPHPAQIRELLERARREGKADLSVWLLYYQDGWETVYENDSRIGLEVARANRDEVYEMAKRNNRANGYCWYHIYRARLSALASGRITLDEVEFETVIPGSMSLPQAVDPGVSEVSRALDQPAVAHASSSLPEDPHAVAGDGTPANLGRPFETPVAVIEGELESIEANLGYIRRELDTHFGELPELVVAASRGATAWQSAISEHARPAIGELRTLLAIGRSPEPAHDTIRWLDQAAAAYHEAVVALQEAKERDSSRDKTLLFVLMAESGGNILGARQRIRRELYEILRLWAQRGGANGKSPA